MATVTVKFNGMWKLYVGQPSATVNAATIEEALSVIGRDYAPIFESKLTARGVKLEGGILKLSYVTLNKKSAKDVKVRELKDGDILDLFVAVPGG